MALYKPGQPTMKKSASMFKGHSAKTTRLPKISAKSGIKGIKAPKMPKAPKVKAKV